MKIFPTSLIRELDEYTIQHEPIVSIDLMERAACSLCNKILEYFRFSSFCVLAGPGNNGGDALALSRMLLEKNYSVKVFLLHTGNLSADCQQNKERLIKKFPDCLQEITSLFSPPDVSENTIIIDGLFGSGLSRPLSGIYAKAVQWINASGKTVIAIDIPSGLAGEENRDLSKPIVRANYTFSFQFPKLSFFFPENEPFVGKWEILDIGIHPDGIVQTETNYYFLEKSEIKNLLHERKKFSHKGTYGHLLIIAGSKGMAGAAVLASKAALRSGVGLVTMHGPACNRIILQTKVPEALFESDKNENWITQISDLKKFNSLVIGPGIGLQQEVIDFVKDFIVHVNKPCVFDADVLNIISINKKNNELLLFIPYKSILTPHPKEFERLFGRDENSFDRMLKIQRLTKELKIIIVLKGAYTIIGMPDGNIFFNSTGNNGMATGGTGDVLTGIIGSLLAQNYTSEEAAIIGVYLHGLAGDLALADQSPESLIAGDVVESIGKAFQAIRE
ncbi:MAG TPA: NAD(P)H-hydrate dehydratase [Paludibacteraceae bacterium]|nr:NAD(P)H-hydrate dehydratase [Paludibacteraceae bacterium]